MAEIPIKNESKSSANKKSGSLNWLWLVLAAVIVALLVGWFLISSNTNDETKPVEVSENLTISNTYLQSIPA